MKKTNIFIATVLLFLLLAPTKAHAADPDNNPCKGFGWAAEPKACIFYKIKTSAAKEIDITRTVLDTFVAGVVEVPIAATTNMGQEDMLRCGGKLIQDYGLSFDTETATSAAEAADSTLCEEWKQDLYAAGDSILSGSLVSLAANTINTLHEAPVPVNLAYYWDSVKQDTLILNQTAYAQSKATYPAMGLEAILSIWEITRNIAFGVLALVMLVIGMMIMLRKQINPQTVVTVQSMLPRVIVSAILIAFSYPIGALMVSLILPLNLAALGIVGSIVIESFSNLSLLPVLFFIIVSVLGVGVANLIVATVMTIGTLVITIIAGIKGLIILFQMLLSIITAPLTFAAAALPGNEEAIPKWFKSMIAKMLAVPAMIFAIALSWTVPILFLSGTGSGAGNALGLIPWLSTFFAAIFIPLFMITILVKSLSLPKMIEEALTGETRYKKK